MALTDKKITEYASSIASLPDKVENSAAMLKELFDSRTNNEVKDSVNGIVDELLAQTAAEQIGVNVPTGVTAQPNIQSVVDGLNERILDEVYLTGAADMTKAVYDPNGDGKVKDSDNSEKLGGQLPAYYATAQDCITAQTTADTANSTANTAKATAENAMPKAGGVFSDDAFATSVNRTGYCLRNAAVVTSAWGYVATNSLVFLRK